MRAWYSIMENVNLGAQDIQSEASFVENISFPTSAYRYFKLATYNGKNDPLNIISVSKHLHAILPEVQPLLHNPDIPYSRKDSNRITYLLLKNRNAYHINNIFLHVNGPRFFQRKVEVLAGNRLKGDFMISSDSVFNFKLPLFNDTTVTILVYNEDNPSTFHQRYFKCPGYG